MRFGLNTSDPERMAASQRWGYDVVEIGTRAGAPLTHLAEFFHVALQSELLDHLDAARGRLAHVPTSGPDRHLSKQAYPWDHRGFLLATRRAG